MVAWFVGNDRARSFEQVRQKCGERRNVSNEQHADERHETRPAPGAIARRRFVRGHASERATGSSQRRRGHSYQRNCFHDFAPIACLFSIRATVAGWRVSRTRHPAPYSPQLIPTGSTSSPSAGGRSVHRPHRIVPRVCCGSGLPMSALMKACVSADGASSPA